MIVSAKKQCGLTFISLMILLALIAFFVLLTLKILPIYMDHSKVVNAFAALEAMPDIQVMRKDEIITSLDKRFSMNYLDKVNTDDVTIEKQGNYVKVEIRYERVEKILGNLSILAEFEESFEVGTPE